MINKVILMGRLTADPELKTTQSGVSMCRFTVAINRPYKNDGQQQADFVNVQAWRSTAEFVCKYFSKGKMIIVEGSLQNNNYESNGVKHYTYVVNAETVAFGESKSQSTPTTNSSTPVNTNTSDVEVSAFEEILGDGDTPF